MSRAEEFHSVACKALNWDVDPELSNAPPKFDLDFDQLRDTAKKATVFEVSSLQYFEAWGRDDVENPTTPSLPAQHCFIAVVGDSEEQDMFLFDDKTGDPIRVLGIFLSHTDQFRAWFAFETATRDVIFDAAYLNEQWYEHANKVPTIVPELVRIISN